MSAFNMPKLGADMVEGRLLEWRKHPGDRIMLGEIIAVIETDKAVVDVEAFISGVMTEQYLQPSEQWLVVGTPLAAISSAATGTAVSAAETTRLAPSAPGEPTATLVSAAAPITPAITPAPRPVVLTEPEPSVRTATPTTRVVASPAARARAGELGIDLRTVQGTGPNARIGLRDLGPTPAAARPLAPKAERHPAPQAERQVRMREAIANAMTRSKREIPHYYLATTIDLARAVQWMTEINLSREVSDRLILGVLLIKAVARALEQIPDLNGFYIEGQVQPSAAVHIGTAITLRGGGLIAPALLNAPRRTLTELMHDYQDLVQRARGGSLRSSELTSATITVTSLGDRGVETVFGVIYPPQLALVGFGRPSERAAVVDGRIVARPMLNATLSADHRASDGHRGALFLDAIAKQMREPEKL
jgi:pyruvate dehydrogenase E2 component (dihydrolipoamide acetyltransferase)